MSKKIWLAVCGALVLGFVIFAGLRVVFIKQKDVHYHANFGLFINGERDKFDNFSYYEEVSACSQSEVDNPKHNVHMHDREYQLIHVHAHAATWGAFFANLGYTLGNKVVATGDGVYADGQDGKKLRFLLNGKPVDTVADRVIQDQDALLVSYGDENDAALQGQYKQIEHSAAKEDAEQDPASCSGTGKLTLKDRVKKAFDFTN